MSYQKNGCCDWELNSSVPKKEIHKAKFTTRQEGPLNIGSLVEYLKSKVHAPDIAPEPEHWTLVQHSRDLATYGIAGPLGGNSISRFCHSPVFVLKRVHRRQPNAEEFYNSLRLSKMVFATAFPLLPPLTDGLLPGFGEHGLHFNQWWSVDSPSHTTPILSAKYLYNCMVATFSSPIYNAKNGRKVAHFMPTESRNTGNSFSCKISQP